MTVKVAVLQSNYLPWIGYFDLIATVDICVFYDDVQYTKNDWRNRNRILTKQGLEWLTVPVGQSISRLINQVVIRDPSWQTQHYKRIKDAYAIRTSDSWSLNLLDQLFMKKQWRNLSELNQETIRLISRNYLNIETHFDNSVNYDLQGTGEARLLALLSQLQATHYLSGPAGANYLNPKHFQDAGVVLEFYQYPAYLQYEQIRKPFVSKVSIIDLLLSTQTESSSYLLHSKGGV
jgi:hypothetical protein